MVCGRSRSQALYSSVYSAEAVNNLMTDPEIDQDSGWAAGRACPGRFWISRKVLVQNVAPFGAS